MLNHPLEPLCAHWPPGLPLLLSVFGWLPLEQHILAAKLLISLLGVGCVFLAYFYYRHLAVSHKLAILMVLALGLNPLFYGYSHSVLSEVPYTFFSIGALLAVEKAFSEGKHVPKKFLVVGIMFLSVAILTRSVGVTLVFATFLWCLIHANESFKGWPRAGLGVVSGLSVLPWATWSLYTHIHRLAGETVTKSYFSQFLMKNPYLEDLGVIGLEDLVKRFIYNLASYFLHASKLLGAQPRPSIAAPLGVLLAFMVVAGFISTFLKGGDR